MLLDFLFNLALFSFKNIFRVFLCYISVVLDKSYYATLAVIAVLCSCLCCDNFHFVLCLFACLFSAQKKSLHLCLWFLFHLNYTSFFEGLCNLKCYDPHPSVSLNLLCILGVHMCATWHITSLVLLIIVNMYCFKTLQVLIYLILLIILIEDIIMISSNV